MNYKDHEITLNVRRIIVEESSLDDDGEQDGYPDESWAESELSRWYTTPDIDRKFRTINALKKAIDKLEKEQS